MVQVNIDRRACRRGEERRRLLTLFAGRSVQNMLKFLDLTDSLNHAEHTVVLQKPPPMVREESSFMVHHKTCPSKQKANVNNALSELPEPVLVFL